MKLNFTTFPTITTDRLILRKLNETDASFIALLRSNEDVNRYISRPKTTTLQEAKTFIDNRLNSIENNEAMYWAITLRDDDSLIGTVCMFNIIKEQELVELGYELYPDFQGKGIMTEAITAVINWGFNTIGFKVIVALVQEENTKSLNVLLKTNFKLATNYSPPTQKYEDDFIVYYLKNDSST